MLKILEMTATFGKLDGATLHCEEGLTIFEAPNEWGKSTWCAFLCAMLYGMDTRGRSTKTALSDREHYAPWSGRPMSGSLLLDWDGRKIRINRTTTRIPMGTFQAYEEETGLEVKELTGDNCGKVLLGVEKEVFLRVGFLRQWDLPVSDHALLRQRLSNLVTTGEENGDDLLKTLREHKNRLAYRNTGILPVKRKEFSALRQLWEEGKELHQQSVDLQDELTRIAEEKKQLENHDLTLRYAESLQNQARVETALAQLDALEADWQIRKAECTEIPEKETILGELDALKKQRRRQRPVAEPGKGLLALAVLFAAAGIALPILKYFWGLGFLAFTGVCVFAWRNQKKKADAYTAFLETTDKQLETYEKQLHLHEEAEAALNAYRQQGALADELQRFYSEAPAPSQADACTLTREETEVQKQELDARQNQCIRELGQLEGRYRSLNLPTEEELETLRRQIGDLEKMDKALALAITTAEEARQELQGRFAPGVTKKAAAFFWELTGGRYDRITISEDFALLTADGEQPFLRSPLWCSDGTADALYFSLRLALAETLCPGAPLVLDDVFVRFDDGRLETAMGILQEMGTQVLVFTCQTREKTIENKRKSEKTT